MLHLFLHRLSTKADLIRPHGEQLTLTETFLGTIKEALSGTEWHKFTTPLTHLKHDCDIFSFRAINSLLPSLQTARRRRCSCRMNQRDWCSLKRKKNRQEIQVTTVEFPANHVKVGWKLYGNNDSSPAVYSSCRRADCGQVVSLSQENDPWHQQLTVSSNQTHTEWQLSFRVCQLP